MNVYIGLNRIPDTYQEVEYIETTGTQFINTGLYAGNNIQVETKIVVNSTSQPQIVFACYKSSGSDDLPNYYGLAAYQNRWFYGFNGSEGSGGNYNPTIGTEYAIVYNNANNHININGSDVLNCSGTAGYIGTTIGIGVRGNRNLYGSYKYYYFKMYNKTTGTYERDFVPCYRKSDNVIGLYDLVNSVFYTNAGTGTFTKGNDVTSLELKNDYIGEYKGFEYNYDFRNKSASQLSNDGWTVLSGRLETGSNGITSNPDYDVSVGYTVDLTNAKKIILNSDIARSSDASYTNSRAAIIGFHQNQSGGSYVNFYLASNASYSGTKVLIGENGAQTQGNNIGDLGRSSYSPILEVDLVNKIVTGKISGYNNSVLTLTDSQVSLIRSFKIMNVYTTQHTYYIQNVSVTVE